MTNEFKEKCTKFIVPFELKNDIAYCQRSLKQYIHMHQVKQGILIIRKNLITYIPINKNFRLIFRF